MDLIFNFGGSWEVRENDELFYVNGSVDMLYEFDPDFLNYGDLLYRYQKTLGYPTVKKIFVREPGKNLREGLFLVHDDDSIRRVLSYITNNSWVGEIEFYADHEVDVPEFGTQILPLPYNPSRTEAEGAGVEAEHVENAINEEQVNADVEEVNAFTDEVNGNAEEVNAFTDEVNNLRNVGSSEKDAVNTTYVPPNGYVSEPEEEGLDDPENEDDDISVSGEEDEVAEEVPLNERVHYDGDQGHFILGMTFANAGEAREAIAKYAVAQGKKLKIHPNEPHRIRVKCINEEGCPFLLYISKDGDNPGLAVKTLQAQHRCYRHFSLPSASYSFLAKHFKNRIYKNPAYRVVDMKDEVEEVLKVNVSLFKCKRAKRKIIQELDGSFRVEFGYLEAYAAALKRSNPGSKAEIELCKDALKEGQKVFRRMFVCFDVCRRGWKAECRPIIGLDGYFLKGVCKGQLLSAIGIDRDDQMVPIAWAVIDKENINNWK